MNGCHPRSGLPVAMLSHIVPIRPAQKTRTGRAYYAEQNIPADVHPFFDDIPTRIARRNWSFRAGASTVADISVLDALNPVPLAMAIRDEQSANAMGLVTAGAAELIRQWIQVDDLTTRQAIFNILEPAKWQVPRAASCLMPQRLMDLIQTVVKKTAK